MKYKAKVNFSGNKISMCVGEVKEVADDIAKDLLRAGYIEKVDPAVKGEAKTEAKAETKTKKGAKA